MFDELVVRNEISYKFSIERFGKATLIMVKQHNWNVTRTGKKFHKNGHNSKWNVCISTKYFDSMKKKKKEDPRWVLEIGSENSYVALTEKYHKSYLNYSNYTDYDNMYQDDVLSVLKAGDFHLIVIDKLNEDGYMYDLNNNPILRKYPMDYISGGITEEHYYIKKTAEHLKKHHQCKSVKIIDIPYYNQNIPNERAVELIFVPDKDQFLELTKLDCFKRTTKIKKIIEVEQFRKEETNDDYD